MTVIQPFDQSGIVRGHDGIARYEDLATSLVELLRQSVEKAPSNEALVEVGGERLTYRELWDRAAKVAGGLCELGIQPGDRVAIHLGNGIKWCLAFFGAQMAGAIVVPVNTRFTEPEVAYVVNDSGSRYVFEPEQPLPQGAR